MRVLACVGLLTLCLGLCGCHWFGTPKPQPNPPGSTPGPGTSPGTPPIAQRNSEIDGLLAGRVVDNYNPQPSKPIYIQVVALDGGGAAGAPIEVATDPQGFFTIPGLQRGQHYKLVARSKDRKLAGISFATAPDARLVIHVSEDYASTSTPETPTDPTWPGTSPTGPKGAGPKTPGARPDGAWSPQPGAVGATPGGDGAAPQGSGGLGQPTPSHNGNPQPPGADSASGNPNVVDTSGPYGPAPINPRVPQVPFCRLENRKLDDLALNDLDGNAWHFKGSPHGKLILVDFWGTWCGWCKRSIPDLVSLQNRYGPFGLDVIGIDYENEMTPDQQRTQVLGFRDRQRINYRVLLGGDMDTCPVKNAFGVRVFPTVFLMNGEGQILWQSEGLTEDKLRQLEYEIRQRLGIRDR